MVRRLVIFLFLSVICIRLGAQDINENNFASYTRLQGLSHNTVTGIAQDSIGYIWISTLSGLNRYDGSSFVQYHSSNDSLSLPAEELIGLTWIDRQRLVSYATGLYIINTATGDARNLLIPFKDKQYQYKFNSVVTVSSNAEGHLFILTRSGLYHYDRDYHLLFRFDAHPEEEVSTSAFAFGRELLWLDKQRLMVVTVDGIYIYNTETKRLRKMNVADYPLLATFLDYPATFSKFYPHKPGVFFAMKRGSDSLIYINLEKQERTAIPLPFQPVKDEFSFRSRLIAVSDTLLCIMSHTSGFYKMRMYPETGKFKFYAEKYFPSYFCNAILKDKDHNLWLATNKGLFREDRFRLQIQMAVIPPSLETSFPNIVAANVYTAGDKLYVSTRGRGGLLIFDKASLRFIRRISTDHIYSIQSADPATLMIAANGPPLLLDIESDRLSEIRPDNWSKNEWAADLYRARNGIIWMCAGDIYSYDPAAGKFSVLRWDSSFFSKIQWPRTIREDASGNIWIAGHGLCRYNTSTKNFDLFIDSFPFIKMPDKQVNALVSDQQNNIWFNSLNNGLISYNIDKKTFHHFTRADGLPDNNISSLIIIGKKLWIATYSGIACMDLQTRQIINFEKEDGFPDVPVVKGAGFFYDSSSQQLYLGLSNVVVRFNPYDILQRKFKPAVFIETLAIDGQKNNFLPAGSIITAWQENDIRITIGSINFSNEGNQRFAYRILQDKADNASWSQLGNQTSFNVSNLSPGHYRIQVKLFSPSHRWPEQVKEIRVTVLPPFWQQAWFILLLGAVLLTLIYLLIRWRTGVARKKEMEKTHIQELKADNYKTQFELGLLSNHLAEARLSALQAQMNPHFVFNALNSINRMILDQDNEKASVYLGKFALLIRMTLEHSKETFVTLNENIEYLRAYLEMEQLRLDDSFTYNIFVDENIDAEETTIPSLMIQPLIENAIWHGLIQVEGEKKISILFEQNQNRITCTIGDNGIGIRQSEKLKEKSRSLHKSMGLENLYHRIKIMNEKYKLDCSLHINDLQEAGKRGTQVVLCFTMMHF